MYKFIIIISLFNSVTWGHPLTHEVCYYGVSQNYLYLGIENANNEIREWFNYGYTQVSDPFSEEGFKTCVVMKKSEPLKLIPTEAPRFICDNIYQDQELRGLNQRIARYVLVHKSVSVSAPIVTERYVCNLLGPATDKSLKTKGVVTLCSKTELISDLVSKLKNGFYDNGLSLVGTYKDMNCATGIQN